MEKKNMTFALAFCNRGFMQAFPSDEVIPRDDHAAADIENWMHMEKPTANYRENAKHTALKFCFSSFDMK